MDARVAAVMVRVVFPVILPEDALMVAEPWATELASPLLTVATAIFDEFHVTDEVRSFFVLSE